MKTKAYELIKRAFDIAFSLTMLTATSPVWLITAISIKLSSPGSIFYFANRVGQHEKDFKMYKFRSMHTAENVDEKSLRPEQTRIFGVGRIIRDTKIDELPQFLNVLCGNMSVVGPRPAAKDQTELTRYGKYQASYLVKPGLTSPSALYDYIYGDDIANEAEYNVKVLPTRLDLDLYYLQQRGLLYDCKMILYTVLSIFASILHVKPKGIYKELVEAAKGIREGNAECGVNDAMLY